MEKLHLWVGIALLSSVAQAQGPQASTSSTEVTSQICLQEAAAEKPRAWVMVLCRSLCKEKREDTGDSANWIRRVSWTPSLFVKNKFLSPLRDIVSESKSASIDAKQAVSLSSNQLQDVSQALNERFFSGYRSLKKTVSDLDKEITAFMTVKKVKSRRSENLKDLIASKNSSWGLPVDNKDVISWKKELAKTEADIKADTTRIEVRRKKVQPLQEELLNYKAFLLGIISVDALSNVDVSKQGVERPLSILAIDPWQEDGHPQVSVSLKLGSVSWMITTRDGGQSIERVDFSVEPGKSSLACDYSSVNQTSLWAKKKPIQSMLLPPLFDAADEEWVRACLASADTDRSRCLKGMNEKWLSDYNLWVSRARNSVIALIAEQNPHDMKEALALYKQIERMQQEQIDANPRLQAMMAFATSRGDIEGYSNYLLGEVMMHVFRSESEIPLYNEEGEINTIDRLSESGIDKLDTESFFSSHQREIETNISGNVDMRKICYMFKENCPE